MKKFILILIILSFTVTCHATPLTTESHGINGEIIIKYNDEISPSILLEWQIMDLTVKIDKTVLSTPPKMYAGLFEGNKLKTVQVVDAISTTTQYEFSTPVNLSNNLTNCYIKIFLWEQEMKPINESILLLDSLYPLIYSYDSNNMLQKIVYKNSQIVYNYDDNGNLLGKTIQAAGTPTITTQSANILRQNISLPSNMTENNSSNDDLDEVESFLTLDPAVLKCLVSAEYVDDTWITIYDLSLLDADDLTSEDELSDNNNLLGN